MPALRPSDSNTRHHDAKSKRDKATTVAHARSPQNTVNNGEIDKYDCQPTNFHKGLPHDDYGIRDGKAWPDFIYSLNREDLSGNAIPAGTYASFDVALGPESEDGKNDGRRQNNFAVKTFYSAIPNGEGGTQAPKVRNWESSLGGYAYNIEGPDAGDLAMAPAPTVVSSELCAEMAEVYAMALMRDVPFSKFETPGETAAGGATVGNVIDALKGLAWYDQTQTPAPSYGDLGLGFTQLEERRREARLKGDAPLDGQSLFRGSLPGVKDGPYISQFLLVGHDLRSAGDSGSISKPSDSKKLLDYAKESRRISRGIAPTGSGARRRSGPAHADGYIIYGAQRIDQRVDANRPGRDYMTDWRLWLDVQNGANVAGTDIYLPDGQTPRFIATPRDLATFVHFDQLYQAYLNACLLLFGAGVPFDYGFPSGSSHFTRGSFATFGGPHVLSLLTEVASRALKAVRRQKFQHHLRGRPEQLAAMLTLVADHANKHRLGNAADDLSNFVDALQHQTGNLLSWINTYNEEQNDQLRNSPELHPRPINYDGGGYTPPNGQNYLLPMAFPEGSPMHASYGAGHATVAGACTTVLKAFFEMSAADAPPVGVDQPMTASDAEKAVWWVTKRSMGTPEGGFGLSAAYQADDVDPQKLTPSTHQVNDLTIEGELNKAAANISIGRNMAGVHFYTDYYDSIRMGERLAVGILEEQMVMYPDPVSMRLTTFDNDAMVISGNGAGQASIRIGNADGTGFGTISLEEWWNRHVSEF